MGVRHCEEEDTNPPRNGIHSYPSYFHSAHLRHKCLPSEASLANRFEVFLSVRTKNKNRRREDEKVVIWNLRDFLFLVGCSGKVLGCMSSKVGDLAAPAPLVNNLVSHSI